MNKKRCECINRGWDDYLCYLKLKEPVSCKFILNQKNCPNFLSDM